MLLTKAQLRFYDKLPLDGAPKCFNGRARSRIKALERAGLVTAEWDLQPRVMGRWVECITVRRKIP